MKTSREAFLVIEGLKGMFIKAMNARHGKEWWTLVFTDRRIDRFIKEYCPEEYR